MLKLGLRPGHVNPRECGGRSNWSDWSVCSSGFTATLSRAVLKAEAQIDADN